MLDPISLCPLRNCQMPHDFVVSQRLKLALIAAAVIIAASLLYRAFGKFREWRNHL